MTVKITGLKRDGCEATYTFERRELKFGGYVYERKGRKYYMTPDCRLRTPKAGTCGFAFPLLRDCRVEEA